MWPILFGVFGNIFAVHTSGQHAGILGDLEHIKEPPTSKGRGPHAFSVFSVFSGHALREKSTGIVSR